MKRSRPTFIRYSPEKVCPFPFTEEEAKKWVMDRLDADTYVTLFGKIEE